MDSRRRKHRKLLLGVCCAGVLIGQVKIVGKAVPNVANVLSGGAAAVLRPVNGDAASVVEATFQELGIVWEDPEEDSDLVMANVRDALNVREEPNTDAEKVGVLYKDCGGTILERGDGWTLLESGNVVGWCKNEYLLFGSEAEELAQNVGITYATVNTQTLRVRSEASSGAKIIGLLPIGEVHEVVDDSDKEWVCIDYEGGDGYVSAEYVDLSFHVDAGETIEEIKAREEAEREAKRHQNYGEYMTDADTTLLLAALIQCEAGGESYEGQVAVGAVVMNRVRSGAYPNTIHGVIYASGQFTPAVNGTVNQVYESGNIRQSCIQAAQEALSGTSNVGDCTHFRRNNGSISGIVIGNHVFY